jgi:hypothetical protein
MKKDVLVENSVDLVGRTSVVPLILEIICHATGLGFAAVARVTPERWIACDVVDRINFGLLTGGELKMDTAICHEIRQSGNEVLIDHVAEDDYYYNHHTPRQYGFQSYISVPIRLADYTFFGTLCAIDPNPAALKSSPIRDLFKAYASLIAFLIDSDKLPEEQTGILRERATIALKAHLITFTGFNLEEHTATKRTQPMDAGMAAKVQRAVKELEILMRSLHQCVQ